MGNYSQEVKDMIWSYSRLSSFHQCKYAFYLRYIVRDNELYPQISNYYAEVGSYVHDIIAQVLQGKIAREDALKYFKKNYSKSITCKTKPNIMKSAYRSCFDYFATEDFWWVDDYDILGVEMQRATKIAGYNFTVIIDLLLRHKNTGKIVLMDHKSSKYFFKADGTVYKSLQHEFETYKRQMYLYCYVIKEIYGEFPALIVWNHYKYLKFSEIEFNIDDYHESIQWFEDVIHEIENEEDFKEHQDYFYCHNLCNFRKCCEYVN